jgi:putative RNA 2'-phosphotransferase
MSGAELAAVVATNNKKRFEIVDGKIRASQGHSISVDLGYEPKDPPATLYHGTSWDLLEPIKKQGLLKMGRHHVHLSQDVETARIVAARRKRPVVLVIEASKMIDSVFYQSANGVWLVDKVDPQFIGASS